MKCVLSAAAKQNRSLWNSGTHEPGPIGGMPHPHLAIPFLTGYFRFDQDVATGQRGGK